MAKLYLEVEDFIEDFINQLKELIPDKVWVLISDLENAALTAVERSALLSEISDILNDVNNNIESLSKIVENKLEEYVVKSYDFFGLLKDPQQVGENFKEWWWFDTLHKRRTGRFLKELFKESKDNSMERAFALGYLTHYTADTVGHPFVNAISGGPFRTHSQRHKVAENHQDVWAFHKYYGKEFIKSNLAGEYVVDNNKFKLPDDLKKFILQCIQNTYYDKTDSLYGRDIKEDDLDISYSLWLKWFDKATNELDIPEPKPYVLTDEIIETWEKFKENIKDIFNPVGNAGNGGITGLLLALAALIAGPFLAATAAIDFILGTITTLGAAPMRFLLSLSYEYLYDAFMNFRRGVALNGLKFPAVRDLNFYMTKHMLNTGENDKNGHNANYLPNVNAYPSNKFILRGAEAESHLIYPILPAARLENDRTTGFPISYSSKTPSWYIDDPKNRFDLNSYQYYRDFEETKSIIDPKEIEYNFKKLSNMALDGGLGNALVLGDFLYSEYMKLGNDHIFPEFNLDSDRGYAFKCWRKVNDISLINSHINDYKTTNVTIEIDQEVPNIKTDIIYPYGGAL
ncbi:zinc dependent phospholipase C family protein [Mobilitalea sibirica]|uniref:Zinc dependent phospholipase C family protein n=2 Tax=Mobilitalea sibirica TaxID=1462919 RepID=A0A8J7HAH2_9FIRM|nr:zinc dependent phospholipase C family protein [Mobilitalea sibirica]